MPELLVKSVGLLLWPPLENALKFISENYEGWRAMVWVVIVLDVLIAGFCFYLAWRLWKWRLALSRLVIALDLWTLKIQSVMDSENPAKPIVSAQKMTAGLHRHYARLNGQLRLIREILKALGLIPLALRHGRPLIQSLAQRKRQRSHLQLRQ